MIPRGRLAVRAVALAALLGGAPIAASGRPLDATSAPVAALIAYVQAQKTTGFIVLRDGETVLERNWPAPAGPGVFAAMAYERTADGALLEDVASQQKSFVSFLVAAAVDRGMIDVERPVSAYLGPGWSRAPPEEEGRIRVLDVLTMSSGLTERATYAAPPGTVFLYNTPVYAVTKAILSAAAHQPLDIITRDWLTGPAGMRDTRWRRRPAAMADVGNPTGSGDQSSGCGALWPAHPLGRGHAGRPASRL